MYFSNIVEVRFKCRGGRRVEQTDFFELDSVRWESWERGDLIYKRGISKRGERKWVVCVMLIMAPSSCL